MMPEAMVVPSTMKLTLELGKMMDASLTSEEIAEKLHISVNTVKRHLQNIMDKTGFESRLELAMNAKSLGLVVHDKNRTNMYGVSEEDE